MMKMDKKFYITTPIYYPSDKLHIGHSYTTVAVDSMARYKRLRGYDVKFLTGTDEHGQKIERVAREKGQEPKEYVDGIVSWIKDLWKLMDISYDDFIRTTDERHVKCVQKIFKALYDNGDIYKSKYEGIYCTPCETFFTERQLVDGKCPDCGRPVEKASEEAYFFKLSNYTDKILKYMEENPEFIEPETRRNEMINNFLKPGLEDLCVSRTSFSWGIPVDFDEGHVVYVWIDALSNYISALGFLTDDDSEYKKYWPADVHVIGKEIVRFHTIIWPAILMSLDLPLPKKVFAHGWLVIDGGKMSKSKGNVVDPYILSERYGVDAIRYFLMREVAFGQDGNYTNEALIGRINADLANDLGNLVSRTIGMIEKYFGGTLPKDQVATSFDDDQIKLVKETINLVEEKNDKMLFNESLTIIWDLISNTNKYIDKCEPWFMIKDEDKKSVVADCMYVLAETIRVINILIKPVMPSTTVEIEKQLNFTANDTTWESLSDFGKLPKDLTVQKGKIIFPRLDLEKEIEELNKLNVTKDENKEEESEVEEITIDDFMKVNLKTGKILECNKHEKADKLLVSKIQVGEKVHQIVSGIANAYDPEEMVGKVVVVVTNLKPVKLRGVLSEGMILCATDENNIPVIISPEKALSSGLEVR